MQLYRVSSEVYWLSWFKSLEKCQCVSMFPWIAWNGSPLWANCWGGFAELSRPFLWLAGAILKPDIIMYATCMTACESESGPKSFGHAPLKGRTWTALFTVESNLIGFWIWKLVCHCTARCSGIIVLYHQTMVLFLFYNAHLQFQLLSAVASVHIPVSQL